MAQLTTQEFEQCLTVLADGGTAEKLRDRLVRLNAFHSRRGLGSFAALATRVYQLSSGLRRQVPATRAFQALWAEHIGTRLTEEAGEKLDKLADAINEQLETDGRIKDGCEATLDEKLQEYEDVLARKVGGLAARLDTLQKALPSVAEKLRARPLLDVPLDPPEDKEGHDHDHDHDHDHSGHHHHH